MGLYTHRLASKTVAEDIAARGLNLPSWPDISDADFDLVCRSIEGFF
jgi:dTDP-4-amino-4,6-dideoxygalactose transaminase